MSQTKTNRGSAFCRAVRPLLGLLALAAVLTLEIRGPLPPPLGGGSASGVVEARRGGRWFHRGAYVTKTADLPDTEAYAYEEDAFGKPQYFDIGYRWEGLEVLFLPVHHWGGTWCGYVDDDTAVDVDYGRLAAYANEAGVEMGAAGPGFWWTWGGKLTWLGIIVLLLLLRARRRRQRMASASRLAAHRGRQIAPNGR